MDNCNFAPVHQYYSFLVLGHSPLRFQVNVKLDLRGALHCQESITYTSRLTRHNRLQVVGFRITFG